MKKTPLFFKEKQTFMTTGTKKHISSLPHVNNPLNNKKQKNATPCFKENPLQAHKIKSLCHLCRLCRTPSRQTALDFQPHHQAVQVQFISTRVSTETGTQLLCRSSPGLIRVSIGLYHSSLRENSSPAEGKEGQAADIWSSSSSPTRSSSPSCRFLLSRSVLGASAMMNHPKMAATPLAVFKDLNLVSSLSVVWWRRKK